MEGFVPIAGYEGSYSVSPDGQIYSNHVKRLLTPNVNKKKYRTVALYLNGAYRTTYVHRIVAEAFLGPSNGLHVNHKDSDKSNNAASNLEWVTITQNNHHTILAGRKTVRPETLRRIQEASA